MHWSLPELRALRRVEYDVLIEWLQKQQQPTGEPAEDMTWP